MLARLRPRPTDLMRAAGLAPDPWQRDALLSDSPRVLFLTTRQAGKSTTVGALAAFEAVFKPGSLTLLLSPSLRQSAELFRKVTDFYRAIPQAPRLVLDSTLRMELPSGSRVLSLPGTESTIRGYSKVDLLVVDEAARVPDSLYHSVRPMLAVSGGRLVALSTPWAKAGWYYAAWTSPEPWERFRVTASDCPRIPSAFLEEERRALPPSVFAREYEATFTDAEDAYFRDSDIERALASYVEPLFLPEKEK
ncbi:MAG: terminase family protein [Thermoanaerobaculia bacterium]